MKDIQRVLVPGGSLHFWTDVKEYFDETIALVHGVTALEGPYDVVSQPAMHDMDYRTHFERRVRMNGLPVYRAEFAKPTWSVEYTVDCSHTLPESPSPESTDG